MSVWDCKDILVCSIILLFWWYSAGSTVEKDPLPNACSYPESSNASCSVDRYSMFVEFCKSGLGRLGLSDSLDIKFSKLWDEVEEFSVSCLMVYIYIW